ncbi:DUF4355 domain-containing protein [Bifidobacterium sp. ESL0745]|uniref:capsid assembly scaffolding protein Gp46 family protein n=1 Tax=Bifidobacterium sp. ESL0745 TaxID=2983226 RepID=UPI0023FA2FB6|nr:DUF4355 domain-containing protein [Bifidobacterium sp. ESL0745]MDF7665725.1 DUF4355 domain-containing protein [Bifidobacterium sp. ESL0745]
MHKHGIFGSPLWRLRLIETPGEGGSGNEGDPQPPADPPQQSGNDPDGEKLGPAGLKALKAEREENKATKAKLAEAEAKIKEFEDKDKTESEKQAEHLKELEASSSANERKATQYEVAAEKGIPLKLATRLRGSTKEEMLADADSLAELLKITPKTPKADPSQGKGDNPKPTTLQEAIAGHLK